MVDLPAWAASLLNSTRVGHLATVSTTGRPHVVPVCFVLIAGAIYTPIDEKPKSGRKLTRISNLEETPHAAFVVDAYDDDWTQLAWVQGRGDTRLVQPEEAAHRDAVAGLREKYPQYRLMALENATLIELRVSRWRWWRWS